MIPDEYYVYDDGILAHGQFGTRFPLRDDPYHPDYEPFWIMLTPAVFPQALPPIPEQTEGAGPSNVPCTLENPNKQNPPKKEMLQKKQTVKDPLSTLTLQKKQTHLYIIHKSQKDMNSSQHLQKYNRSRKSLSNLILMLSQLTTFHQSSKYFHWTHPNF